MLNKICFSSTDEKIKGHMTTLEEILQNPEFGTFHNTGKEVNGNAAVDRSYISDRVSVSSCLC